MQHVAVGPMRCLGTQIFLLVVWLGLMSVAVGPVLAKLQEMLLAHQIACRPRPLGIYRRVRLTITAKNVAQIASC